MRRVPPAVHGPFACAGAERKHYYGIFGFFPAVPPLPFERGFKAGWP